MRGKFVSFGVADFGEVSNLVVEAAQLDGVDVLGRNIGSEESLDDAFVLEGGGGV